jgi:hypothetical protein
MAPNALAGYCALIWAQPVHIEGSFVGIAVADDGVFRFFSADVRLDELDGLTSASLSDLQSRIRTERSLIMAELAMGRFKD